jgi:hypothetical protein
MGEPRPPGHGKADLEVTGLARYAEFAYLHAVDRVRQLCDEAVADFDVQCFWWADRRPGRLNPQTVVKGLRDYGGHAGLRRAKLIEEVMRAAEPLPEPGSAAHRGQPQSG